MDFESILSFAILSFALLFISTLFFATVRYEKCKALDREFMSLAAMLSQALKNCRSVYCELNDSCGINNSERKFEGLSLGQHNIARSSWNQFNLTFAFALSKEELAKELKKQYLQKSWWQQRPKLIKNAIKELCEGECEGLVARIEAEAEVAGKYLLIFSTALKTNDQNLRLLKTQVEGEKESLLTILQAVQSFGQVHPRYHSGVNELQLVLATLQLSLQLDPLNQQTEAVKVLRKKICKQASLLRRAVMMHKGLDTLRSQIDQLRLQIESLRQKRLSSPLTKARYFKTGYTLDEPGFVVQDLVDECDRLLEAMDKALFSRRLYSFGQAHKACSTLTVQANLLLQEILADKSFVDEQMKAIKGESSAEDRRADKTQRARICRLYRAQRWHAAMLEVKQLLLVHNVRVQG